MTDKSGKQKNPNVLVFPNLRGFNKTEYNNYNTARCNVCFTKNRIAKVEKLRFCAACKLVGYCSIECQKDDWKFHKSMCAAIIQVYKEENITHMLEYKRTKLSNGTKMGLHCLLNFFLDHVERKLERYCHPYENVTIRFPVICQYCYEHDYRKLTRCKCHQIFYCSELHRKLDKNHSKFCDAYRINYELSNNYVNLDFYDDIDEDTVSIEKNKNMPIDVFDLVLQMTGKKIPRSPTTAIEAEDLKKVAMYSNMATIIYALKKIEFDEYLRKTVVMHIVGVAEDAIYFEKWCSLPFFSFFPHVQILKLFFIGPESLEDMQTCTYTVASKSVVMSHRRMTYQHCLRNVDNDFPSVVVAFNCGFSAEDNPNNPWKSGIASMLLFENVPIIFTSYTRAEMYSDIAVVDSIAKEALTYPSVESIDPMYQVVLSQENPFRDPKPLRNCDIYDKNDEIYYRNGYVTTILVDGQSHAIVSQNYRDREMEAYKDEEIEISIEEQ